MNMLKRNRAIILFLIVTLIIVSGFGTNASKMDTLEETKEEIQENIEVHYIDVGQGDAILIKQGKSNMLIDAGDNQYGQRVVDYLKENEIDTLDYVIGTHPHADHIGGLDDVIKAFNIGKIIMPKVTHTTKTFEDVLLAIKDKGLKITTPIVGDIYELGDAKFTILGPNKSEYSNLNNYSVATRLEFGENSFIFTGDAEAQAETEITNNKINIKSDVLKVGHHGSQTSSLEVFLDKVLPKYGIITVGAENQYGHPDDTIIKRLENRNIKVFRSDLHGTIIAKGNGTEIIFKTKETAEPEGKSITIVPATPTVSKENKVTEKTKNTKPKDITNFIGNKNSKIFHHTDCSSLPGDKNRVIFNSKEAAINAGHRACKRCKP